MSCGGMVKKQIAIADSMTVRMIVGRGEIEMMIAEDFPVVSSGVMCSTVTLVIEKSLVVG